MTNAEMYKKVFGFNPDINSCPTNACSDCPNYTDAPLCTCNWWLDEYTGNALIHVELIEKHQFASPDQVNNIDFPNSSKGGFRR